MSASRRAAKARAARSRASTAASLAAAERPVRRWLVPALATVILAAGAWAFSNSFSGAFVLDDVRAIVRNPSIRRLWPLSVPLSPPSESTVSGRPVANLSFAMSYAMGAQGAGQVSAAAPARPAPIDPGPFHAGNLATHLTSALVLFGIVRRTLESPRLRDLFGPAAPWLAGSVALVWVVHPLQTAAVTYIVQRVESLMGLFYLLTLYCAIRASEGRRKGWWATAAVVFCAAGMGTKEAMVTAPIMVALWDHLFATRPDGQPSGVRWRLTGALAATWLLLAFLVSRQFRGPSINLSPEIIWVYARTQAEVVVHYLRLAFIPAPLVFLYDWPLIPAPLWGAWQAVLLTGLAVLTVVGTVKRHPAAFLGGWFFLVLAPSSSVLPIVTEVAAEHRMYLPLAAVVTTILVGVYLAVTRLAGRWKMAAIGAAAVAILVVAGALGTVTRTRNVVYASAESLWADTVAKRPDDPRPRVAYGEALAQAGRNGEAEVHLKKAVELAPGDPLARVRLGSVLARQGKYEEAIGEFVAALALRPGDVDAHRFLGEIYVIQRKDRLAVQHYGDALAAVPGDPRLMVRLAVLLAESQDPDVRDLARARALAREAVRLDGGRDPRLIELLKTIESRR